MRKYNTYNKYNGQWVKLIPDHWKISSFRHCLQTLTDFTANGSFATLAKNVTYLEMGYSRLVRLTDLRKNLDNDGIYISQEAHLFLRKSELIGGELLIANVGAYAGLVKQMPKLEGKFTLGPNMFLVRLNQNEKYFFYLLNSPNCSEQLKLKAISSAQPKLNKDDIREIEVIIPPLEEQLAIATFLDRKTSEIDTLIEKKKQLIVLLKEERTAIINHAVTKGINPDVKYKDGGIDWIGEIPEHWEVKKLKYLAKICNGKDQKEVLDESGVYPIYGSGGVFGKANRFLYDRPSVLLGRKGTIDRPQLVKEPFWTVDTSYYTIINDNVSVDYFYYLCTTINFDLYKYGSAIPSMTQGHLNEIKFAVPKTLQEQQEVVNYINKKTSEINTIISKTEKEMDLMQEYKIALISEVVTGKVDVREEVMDMVG